jgi:uncharacterized Ntn-hydrolase superfamily protein
VDAGEGDVHKLHRLAHTYSIVAFEEETGRFGVAVQSHYFGVGPIVPWVETGVGAVATQADADVSYGPMGLALMRGGKTAEQSLAALLAADESRETRQVAMVDASDSVSVHTGKKCIAEAGHRTGDGYSVQANLMLNDKVPDAMAEAYESAEGDLPERLMAALEAAEEAGGDIRGRQSSALLVARGPDEPQIGYASTIVDLRVDDDPSPLVALRRLLTVHRGYRWIDEATEALAAGDMDKAKEGFDKTWGLAVGDREPLFWYAVTLVNEGHVELALPIFEEIFTRGPIWLDVLDRLVPGGYFPDDPDLLKRVKAVAKKG